MLHSTHRFTKYGSRAAALSNTETDFLKNCTLEENKLCMLTICVAQMLPFSLMPPTSTVRYTYHDYVFDHSFVSTHLSPLDDSHWWAHPG